MMLVSRCLYRECALHRYATNGYRPSRLHPLTRRRSIVSEAVSLVLFSRRCPRDSRRWLSRCVVYEYKRGSLRGKTKRPTEMISRTLARYAIKFFMEN